MVKKKAGGYKVVLTADRTLMSEYAGGIFLGFSACIPKGLVPDKFYFSLFCPSVPVNNDGSSKYAPCGIRKTESILLNNGFSRDEVIVAHPDYLDKVVGENTRVIRHKRNRSIRHRTCNQYVHADVQPRRSLHGKQVQRDTRQSRQCKSTSRK